MASIIRQRIVGTLVLTALGLVFWPIIFVEPEVQDTITLDPMPPRPTIDESPIPAPRSHRARIETTVAPPQVDQEAQRNADTKTLIDNTESLLAGAENTLPEQHSLEALSRRDEAPIIDPLDAAGHAKAWVLQVATMSSQQRASNLVGTLRKKGYTAFSRPLERNGQTLWRVQIGPNLERAALATLKPKIDDALGVNSVLIRYAQ